MIIIEGPDGTGKTTLARKLSEDLGLELAPKVHIEAPRDVRPMVYNALSNSILGCLPPIIHDRLFFSELVYGPLLRGRCEFSSRESDFILSILRALACPIIFCGGSRETLIKNVANSDQMRGVKENLPQIIDKYHSLYIAAEAINLNTYRYNYETSHYSALKAAVGWYLEFRKFREWSLTTW